MNNEEIRKRVEEELPEIIRNLRTLVSYPSVLSQASETAPFGKDNEAVLKAALEILEGYGFKTKNLDNYIGYGEIGQGDTLVGMVGHLDVVPVSEHWSTNPFELTEKDGNLYGRGTSDDKGPVACAMAALRIVSELRPDLNKRVRLVMGCNEESGSACLEHYVEKEGSFDYGFTPDADFPLVFGEKGMVAGEIICPTDKITYVKGGMARNVVCGEVLMKLKDNGIDLKELSRLFDERNIRHELSKNGEEVTLHIFGKEAHASLPDLGVNAINEVFYALNESGVDDPAVRFVSKYFGLGCHGEGMGINFSDKYGNLTLNLGMISLEEDGVHISIDIRYPVTKDPKEMEEAFKNAVNDPDGKIVMNGIVKPLFFDPDSPLVSSLLKAYRDCTGDYETEPLVIGGGTYAKEIGNTIAFGAEFPNQPDIHMHGDDEFIPIENLTKVTEIYVHGLLNLLDID